MKIVLKNLVKSYDGNAILQDLNLDVDNVKSVGIIGESGCGKSTLLRQLSGIELPDDGTVEVNGTVISENNLKEYQSQIGYVFQKHNLFPHLTIEENITLILEKIKGMDAEAARIKAHRVLREFHLTDQADKIPDKVSGGQAQRGSIARAVSTDPELLFLDEPTAALDPILTREVLDSVRILKNRGTEFLFVTHEMDFLKKFADYFVFMDRGKIIEHGHVDGLNAPKTEKLQKFIQREGE